MENKFVFIISGPTASGKSNFCLQLGQELDNTIEIINADIGSFYTPLTIGTAKPDWKDSIIKHHLFDVLDSPENWTAPQFRAKVQELVCEIWQRGNIPVIVGGSAFYIQSLFYKNYDMPKPDEQLLKKLEMRSCDDLWRELHTIDAVRAEEIDPHDQYRLIRALAIWYTQGKKPSTFKQIFDPIAPFYYIDITRDRDELYSMINSRVQSMIEGGWVAEVRALAQDEAWVDFLYKKKMIGYNEILDYIQGYYQQNTFDEIVALIAQRTRNYAKRQMTFLKKLHKNIVHDLNSYEKMNGQIYCIDDCNLTLCDLSLYIKQLSKFAVKARLQNFNKI